MTVKVSKKVMLIVTLCALAAVVIVGGGLIFTYTKTSDYVKTDAKVTATDWQYDTWTARDSESNHGAPIVHIISISYNANGTKVENEFKTILNYEKGDKITVYYNPDNVKELRSETKPLLITLAGVFLLFILCAVMTKNAEKQEVNP